MTNIYEIQASNLFQEVSDYFVNPRKEIRMMEYSSTSDKSLESERMKIELSPNKFLELRIVSYK